MIKKTRYFKHPILVSFVSVFILLVISILLATTSQSVFELDVWINEVLYSVQNALLTRIFIWITLLGKVMFVFGGAVIASIIFWFWHKRLYIAPLWVTLIGSEGFILVAKLVFHRPRPEFYYFIEQGFSFPSGHATIATVFYGFLLYVLLSETISTAMHRSNRSGDNTGFRGIIALKLTFLILAIGFSRLYLGVHYFSDVWVGHLSGLLFLIFAIGFTESQKSPQQIATKKHIPQMTKVLTVFLILVYLAIYVSFVTQYQLEL